jgi:hypothetical protein
VLRLPGLRPVYASIVESCAELESCATAGDAELWVTGVWASLREKAPPTAAFDLVLLDLIDEAVRAGTAGAYLFLRVLAVLAPAGGGTQAAEAAQRLDVGAPDWADRLGSATVGECYLLTDIFSEQTRLIVEFTHDDGGLRHAFALTQERTFRDLPSRLDLFVGADDVGSLRASSKRAIEQQGGRFRALEPAEAAVRLRTAMARAADPRPRSRTRPVMSATSLGVVPLLERRIATMVTPAPEAEASTIAQEWTEERRVELVDDFLEARAGVLNNVERAEAVADRLVDLSLDVLQWPPDRLGPAAVERLVLDVAVSSLTAPDPVLDDVALVLREWMSWRMEHQGLPGPARDRLRKSIQRAVEVLPRVMRDRSVNEYYPYVADLTRDQAGGAQMSQVVERRCFAVPLPRHRGTAAVQLTVPATGLPARRSTPVAELDAANAGHRAALAGTWPVVGADNTDGAHGTDDADDVRLRAARAGVVEQLWSGSPEEVWAVARALTEAGRPRLEIVDALAAAWRRHGPDALGTGRADDLAPYLAEVNGLTART